MATTGKNGEPKLSLAEVLTYINERRETPIVASTLRGYMARGDANFPPPDGRIYGDHGPPLYYPSTLDAWLASRRGRGWRKGQTGPMAAREGRAPSAE